MTIQVINITGNVVKFINLTSSARHCKTLRIDENKKGYIVFKEIRYYI